MADFHNNDEESILGTGVTVSFLSCELSSWTDEE